jgi:predicted Ser/Thr protein kinase
MESRMRSATVSPDQFVKSLVDSGLMEAAEARQALGRVPTTLRGEGRTIAQEFVRQEKLTSYQANRLLRGTPGKLVFGPYVILEELGEGGMGVVFKAQHRGLNRLVALKLLAATTSGQENALKRFKREMHAAAKLNHPNIVSALDAGEMHGTHFFAMEYARGCDLARWVKQHGPMPVARAVACIRQAAQGLACAHAAGIIHRDIKPSNLLLAEDKDTVKILDMGLARIDKSGARQGNETTLGDLTQTGSIMGTCDYMAPEQALNAKAADQRADIYSLGCTLYFLVAGKPMYRGDTVMEKVFAHREEPIPALPGASRSLQAVFQRMVAKKPEERYGAMTDLMAALESSAGRLGRRSRRGLLWLAGSAAAAAILLAALVLGQGSSAATNAPPADSRLGIAAPVAMPQPRATAADGSWNVVLQPATLRQTKPEMRVNQRPAGSVPFAGDKLERTLDAEARRALERQQEALRQVERPKSNP